MNHKQRGHCLIFNNLEFAAHTGLGVSSDNNTELLSYVITSIATGWQTVFQASLGSGGCQKNYFARWLIDSLRRCRWVIKFFSEGQTCLLQNNAGCLFHTRSTSYIHCSCDWGRMSTDYDKKCITNKYVFGSAQKQQTVPPNSNCRSMWQTRKCNIAPIDFTARKLIEPDYWFARILIKADNWLPENCTI